MRYEHIELDISTAACCALAEMLLERRKALGAWGYDHNATANVELTDFANELRARLQRRDADVQCPKNARIEQVHRDIADQTGWTDGGIEI